MAYVAKPIGARSLTAFPITTDDSTGTTYETAVKVARLIQLNMAPITASGTLESDDGIEDETALIVGYEVTIDASQLTDDIRSKLLGHTLDEAGGLTVGKSDTAPWVGLAWEAELSADASGAPKYALDVLYKGRFQPFEERFETRKRGDIVYQTHSGIKAMFFARESDGAIRYKTRPDNTGYSPTVAAAWFTAPQEAPPPTP